MKLLKIILITFVSGCNTTDLENRVTFNTLMITGLLFVILLIVSYAAYYFIYHRKKFYANGYMSVLMRSHSVDYVPSALAITCDKRKILVWNLRAEEIFSWKESDVIELKLDELIVPENQRKIFDEEFNRVADGLHARYFEICLFRSSKKIKFSAEMKIGAMRQHSSTHYVYTMRDISDHKKKEEEITKQLDLYRNGEELSGFGSWIWDLEKDEVLLSEGFQKVFDIDKKIVTGQFLMKQVVFSDRNKVGKTLQDAILKSEPYEIDYMLKQDGKIIPVVVKAKPIITNGDVVKAYLGIIQVKNYGIVQEELK